MYYGCSPAAEEIRNSIGPTKLNLFLRRALIESTQRAQKARFDHGDMEMASSIWLVFPGFAVMHRFEAAPTADSYVACEFASLCLASILPNPCVTAPP